MQLVISREQKDSGEQWVHTSTQPTVFIVCGPGTPAQASVWHCWPILVLLHLFGKWSNYGKCFHFSTSESILLQWKTYIFGLFLWLGTMFIKPLKHILSNRNTIWLFWKSFFHPLLVLWEHCNPRQLQDGLWWPEKIVTELIRGWDFQARSELPRLSKSRCCNALKSMYCNFN